MLLHFRLRSNKTLTQAVELGGKVLSPVVDMPNVGRFATVMDPQGGVFAAFEPADLEATPGHDSKTVAKEFTWHELATTDAEGAWTFYAALFGWGKGEAMDMGPMGIYQLFNTGTHDIGGIFDKPAEMPMTAWVHYTRVDDVDAAAVRVTELGGKVVNGPMDVPGGDRIVQGIDPQGAFFALASTVS